MLIGKVLSVPVGTLRKTGLGVPLEPRKRTRSS